MVLSIFSSFSITRHKIPAGQSVATGENAGKVAVERKAADGQHLISDRQAVIVARDVTTRQFEGQRSGVACVVPLNRRDRPRDFVAVVKRSVSAAAAAGLMVAATPAERSSVRQAWRFQ